jgi:hypothetical protein
MLNATLDVGISKPMTNIENSSLARDFGKDFSAEEVRESSRALFEGI